MIEKPIRLVDRDVIQKAWERDCGRCLICGESVRSSSVHHIRSRGAGGPDALENLITLCRVHHIGDAHGGKITPDALRAMLTERYGYRYDAA